MRPGSLRLTRLRAARAVAGLVAALLLTGNVLAAAGLCAVKAPVDSGSAPQAALHEADSPPCVDHLPEQGSAGSTAAKHHCPTDDPSAQTRTVDLPSPQLMTAFAAVVLHRTDAARQPAALLFSDDPSGPRPLYARLQRLRL